MIVEIFQFMELFDGRFHFLIVYFLLFVLTASLVKKFASVRYKPQSSLDRGRVQVSIVVPVYREDPEILERCLASAKRNKPDELIVVADCPDQKLSSVVAEYADKVIVRNERRGKRDAIVEGVRKSCSDIIVLLDSDTQMDSDCLNELVKPFDHDDVKAVATVHKPYLLNPSFGGYLSWKFSEQIEKGRRINDRALSGHLIVADGRCSAYRKEAIIEHAEEFLSDIYFGKPSQIGDDRFLTQKVNAGGGKAVLQETAKVFTASPSTFRNFLKQQLRWHRSGRKFFLRDIRIGLWKKTGVLYAFHSVIYYLSAFIFTFAMVADIFVFRTMFAFPLWFVPTSVVIGSTLVNIVRQLVLFGRETNFRDALWFGIVGFFVLYPLSLYSWFTMHKQHVWGTR